MTPEVENSLKKVAPYGTAPQMLPAASIAIPLIPLAPGGFATAVTRDPALDSSATPAPGPNVATAPYGSQALPEASMAMVVPSFEVGPLP